MSRLPSLGPRGEGWVLLQLAVLFAVAWTGVEGRGAIDGLAAGLLAGVGVILIVAGAGLVLRGFQGLGRNLTSVPRPRPEAELVESGIYGRVRHPIYGGLVIAALGWSLALVSFLALPFVLALAVFLDLKSRREEVWLRERFPGYDAYAAGTRRLIPWVY
jgi:protein-S-isoprenylcysteine O-methyltransferase Ste14